MTAQRLAIKIAAFADSLLESGADAELVSAALLGCGVELLQRVKSTEKAAMTLEGVAANIRCCDKIPPTPTAH